MIIIIETVILCIAFFLICFWGTGTDNKNLKSYSSYPDEVQNRIKSIAEYQGKFKESNKVVTFISNFLLFLFVLFILGLFIKENGFTHNFLCLSIIGQGLNIFDLFIVDLLWWRNTKRVRLRKMPEKELYQNPKKHIEAFIRAFTSEMHNLYGQPEYEPVVKELKEEMLKLQEQYNDPVRFSPERDKE